MPIIKPLEPGKLRLEIDPESLGFERLSQLEKAENLVVAQERAVRALDFGLKMGHPDFNVYVAGIQETGLLELAKSKLYEAAHSADKCPSDWCYVYNFKDPDKPLAVELPKGDGRKFRSDMADLVDALKLHIPKSFEGETYLARKEEVIREFNNARRQIFEKLDEKVRAKGFLLQAEPGAMMIIPAKEDGTPLSPEDLAKLSKEKQDELKANSEELHKEMGAAMRRIHDLEKDVRERLKDLDREVARQTTASLLEPLIKKYEGNEVIIDYLDDVLADVVRHLDDFRPDKTGKPPLPFPFPIEPPSFTRYEVNLLVDNSKTRGVPVVIESNPNYPNLFGAVERRAQFGALFTDFTMIKAGALHRANGGFLLLKVIDILKWPFSYEALKRALKNGVIEIEDLGEQFGLFTTKALKPKPIPLKVKIILAGDPYLYQLLYNLDEDFRELFKVKAHLDTMVDRNEDRLNQFLKAVRTFVHREGLKDLHKTAVARLIEHSAEIAGSKEKISLKISDISDLLREADYWAGTHDSDIILDRHIQQAIDEQKKRSNLYEEHIQELLTKDILKVETLGEATGQVNGLAVYDLGDYTFGKPSRITANIALGKDGVINIERESDLSGNIHTKGVMILSGYLRSRFAADRPLSLTATLCFEQSYGMVEGDSASGAELFALLSALSGIKIRQGIACTGAVSQKGEILPVGGVTQKIEGFFDLCKARGLTGDQGVIIPKANTRDLLLKMDIVEAVKEGKFSIWAIGTVEEGIEILTGIPAGEKGPDGTYPEGSVFAR